MRAPALSQVYLSKCRLSPVASRMCDLNQLPSTPVASALFSFSFLIKSMATFSFLEAWPSGAGTMLYGSMGNLIGCFWFGGPIRSAIGSYRLAQVGFLHFFKTNNPLLDRLGDLAGLLTRTNPV
ncbi:hypothetical protein PGQ11_014880 [Apiospora arundinis]|uniref:Uncharacterized protein n=1 Tax=Apiospora arundinis TaxID=335852 RepID=A0ABR2HKC8_9PEZI